MIFKDKKVGWMVTKMLKDPDRLFMTSRVAKEGEEGWFSLEDPDRTVCITGPSGGVKWEVGRSYAIQLGRGKPGIWLLPKGIYRPNGRQYLDDPCDSPVCKVKLRGRELEKALRESGYSKLRLLVVGLRGPEPLQEITEEEAKMEGFGPNGFYDIGEESHDRARQSFFSYWRQLYPKGEGNPLVWRIAGKLRAE